MNPVSYTHLDVYKRQDTGSHPAYEDKVLQDIETGSKYTKSVITQTETSTPNMINYLRSITNFSGDQKTKFDGNLAKQSLFERKPVFLFGSGHIVDKDGNITGKLGGHALSLIHIWIYSNKSAKTLKTQ